MDGTNNAGIDADGQIPLYVSSRAHKHRNPPGQSVSLVLWDPVLVPEIHRTMLPSYQNVTGLYTTTGLISQGSLGPQAAFPKTSLNTGPLARQYPWPGNLIGLHGQLRHPGSSCLSRKEVKEETNVPVSQKKLLTHYSRGPGEWPSKHL